MFIMDSRFHGNDTNVIVVIPAKAGIHPMQESFPRYLPKSQNKLDHQQQLKPDSFLCLPRKLKTLILYKTSFIKSTKKRFNLIKQIN